MLRFSVQCAGGVSQYHGTSIQPWAGQSTDTLHSTTVTIIRLVVHAAHLFADCCFIEDTAVVAGQGAIVARIGASERQGEEAPGGET